MTVGEKIQALRLRAGLSQAQLAEHLCVSRAAVAKWENDNGLPDISNLKALAAFFHIDLNALLDESQVICAEAKETSNSAEPIEIPESFCGKSCNSCEYREETNCPGCREGNGRRFGACRLADCCRNHMYSSCGQCAAKSGCEKHRNIPGQQNSKMKERAEAKIKFRKHAPLMKKWIWVLFWLIIIQTVSDIFEQDFVANWMPLVNQISEYLTIVCSFLYAFVLLKLSPVSEGYRIAGVCFLITDVLNIIKLLAESSNGLKIVLSLVIIVLALVARYNEYMAHAFAVHGLDNYLASNWEALWKWYIVLQAGVVLSIIIAFLGLLPLIMVLFAICGLGVYQLVLLYRTAELFE